ncbi:MAG: acetyl-CoA carboxylase biotin carboxyl carrier protein subunit [Ktedonobacteraceae bacterium]|nr:acetyl-CoA carboxylase biotin carboxyl carrier protein subunit [Ktedonobacteraceae bacterium]
MSRIVAITQQQTYALTIHDADTLNKVELDTHEHIIDWKRLAPLANGAIYGPIGGRYSLLISGKSYDVFARPITRPEEKNGQTYEIFINGQRFEVTTEDERARTLTGLIKGSAHSGEATIYAPMPGLVIGMPLEVGTEVKAGQSVIVLEAMKMENDLSSPIRGKIKEILVNKGQTVDLGAALVIIDGRSEE